MLLTKDLSVIKFTCFDGPKAVILNMPPGTIRGFSFSPPFKIQELSGKQKDVIRTTFHPYAYRTVVKSVPGTCPELTLQGRNGRHRLFHGGIHTILHD